MQSSEIRQKFIEFFKKRGHTEIPSAPLVPENDPTVLFNTAGMQPLVPYLLGEKHPSGDRLVDFQKCVRTNDIDDIGDNTHLTFFEMMGNWSLGAYFKEDAIKWSYELLTSKTEGFGLDPSRLYVTCFRGDESAGIPRDEESANIWREQFKGDNVAGERIYFLGADANWWPAVKKGQDTWTGPTGPCSEMFYDVTGKLNSGMTESEFVEQSDTKQNLVEIWNDVFMEYKKENGKIVGKLENKNVDTGSGFERITMVLQGKDNVFDTDIFESIIGKINEFVNDSNVIDSKSSNRIKRIIADHIRSSVFLISDGVTPSNTDQGYILRRLLRRAVRFADTLGMKHSSLFWIADAVCDKYKEVYKNLGQKKETIKITIDEEEQKFRKTLAKGIRLFNDYLKDQNVDKNVEQEDAGQKNQTGQNILPSQIIFDLYQSYGFPVELTRELASENNLKINEEELAEMIKKHQDMSRSGADQKFKGGLGDTSEQSTKYHTATHLLHQALRDVLGSHVEQRGSNITPERLRFDFSHNAKMTDAEKQRVEEIINDKIKAALPVNVVSLSREQAEKTGALHFFGEKYGDTVTVYYIGDDVDHAYSKEFCGGPHVKNTSQLGSFKIVKEEAVSAGVRRIKAVLG